MGFQGGMQVLAAAAADLQGSNQTEETAAGNDYAEQITCAASTSISMLCASSAMQPGQLVAGSKFTLPPGSTSFTWPGH